MIFGKLPDEIFRPLAGPNRHVFEKVLKQINRIFGDEENPESDALRRDSVLTEIHQILISEEHLALTDEDSTSEEIYNTPSSAAEYIYRRLLATGWLEIEEEGYHSFITPNPYATLLLEALLHIESSEKKSYGLVVVSILSHIETAIKQPQERGMVFLNAVSATREFSAHLRGILFSLKEVQDLLIKTKDPKEILANFFAEFVEGILIADYKTLNSADNPFRFRGRIIELLRQAEMLPEIKQHLIEHYKEHYQIDAENAAYRLQRDIEYIIKIFKGIDGRLNKIDSFCARLQNRVDETVRFIDRTMPGASNRIADLLRNLGEHLDDTEDQAEGQNIPAPPRTHQLKLFSPFSIYPPHGRKEKPSAQVLRSRALSPEAIARKNIIRAYMKKRAFEPMRVVRYLDTQMGGRTVMHAAEFSIESVDDLISFLLIRHLPRMHGKGQFSANAFSVQRKKTRIETEWVACSDFVVQRRLDVK
ncbi:MAG: DUF5716 family protein [Desulfuromonadaceae bacterium]|nr:DUF5716 family protein [Desulfuromonas sp.]MDY0185140.1 DUF5716 family protein [Desulfuromonadaceae bacterium]